MSVFRIGGAMGVMTILLVTQTACSSAPDVEPTSLATAVVSQGAVTLQGAPAPTARGRDLFASEEDRRLVTSFVSGASTLFGGDSSPHPERCSAGREALHLDAPPDDLFAAAGRLRDETTRAIVLNARSRVGLLLSRCLAGAEVDRVSWDVARTSVALVRARLEQSEVTVP